MKKQTWVLVVVLAAGVVVGMFGARRLGVASGSAAAGAGATQSAAASRPAAGGAPSSAAVAPRTVGIEVAPVQLQPMPRSVSAVGTLRAPSAVMLRPEITGRVMRFGFTEGQPVKAGTVLVQLDDSVPKAQLQQAQANLALAQSQYQRSQELTRQGFISQQARDEAFNQLKVQQAAVALAQAQLDKTRITAPFDGVMGLRQVSLGDYVSPGAELVAIESIDPLQVDFRVPEAYVGQLKSGMSFKIEFDALPGTARTGTVAAISPRVDVAGRSVQLRADVPNQDRVLRAGMFARVQMQLSDQPVLVIPETALVSSGADRYVFVHRNGVVRQVMVQIGQRLSGKVEVAGDLKAGDQVVTAGLQKVADGTPVRVLASAEKS